MLSVVLAVVAIACAETARDDETATNTSTSTSRVVTAIPSETPPPEGPPMVALPDLVDELADDLAVPAEGVTVVSDEVVTWNNGGLGCPEPDVAYLEAEVDGRRVILEVDGITYTYHAGLDGGFFLCAKPLPPVSVAPPSTVTPSPPEEIRTTADAVAELAARLGVDSGAVSVVAEEEVTWPDGSLGCPQKDRAYTQALVNGRRVILSVAGVDYHYHGGPTGLMFYCLDPASPAARGTGDV